VLEPSGGSLNRVFGRGTLLRSRVASAALSAKDRVPEPVMRVAMQVLSAAAQMSGIKERT
jgi:acyl-CoA dehydrogenase